MRKHPELQPVSSLVEIFLGGTPKRSVKEYWGKGIKWASAADIVESDTRYIRKTSEEITEKGLSESNAKLLGKDTVVITARGTVGEMAMLPQPMAFNQTCYGLVANDGVLPTYLYYALKARLPNIMSQTYGAVFDTITMKSFENITIPVPGIEIQRSIAEILSAYDDLIENNLRRIEILEEMARLIYREWFVHFRFPGHEEVEMVDSEIGAVPHGWEVNQFSAAVEINPKIAKENEALKPYVSMSEIQTKSLAIEWEGRHRKGRGGSQFANGDVIFPRITPSVEHGKGAYVQFLDADQVAIGSTEFIIFRSDILPGPFIYFLSKQDDFRGNAVNSMVGASGRQRVQNECFDQFLIPIPPEELVREFEHVVLPIMHLIFTLKIQKDRLIKLRNLILPRLISGKFLALDPIMKSTEGA